MGTSNGDLRPILELQPNVPVELALAYAQGKPVQNGQRVMFTLTDDRVLFLDRDQARKIEQLKVKPREPFGLTLKWSGKRGDPKDVVAWLSPEAEKTRARSDAEAIGDTWSAHRLAQSIERTKEVKASIVGAVPARPGDGADIVARAEARKAAEASAPTRTMRMPMSLAIADAVRMVESAAPASWGDVARSGLVQTLLEVAERQGWIGPWTGGPR